MVETLFQIKNGKFIRANFDKNKKHFYIVTNKDEVSFFNSHTTFNLKMFLHKPSLSFPNQVIKGANNSPWFIEAAPQYQGFVTLKLKKSLVYLLKGTIILNHDSKNDVSHYVICDDPISVQDFSVIDKGNSASNIEFIKNIDQKSPHKFETASIMAGAGDDKVTKEIYLTSASRKKGFHQFRFHIFGGQGNDYIQVLNNYGINHLSGGKGNDKYHINIEQTKFNFEYELKQERGFLFYHVNDIIVSPYVSFQNSLEEFRPFFTGKKAYNESFVGITFVNDFGKENNQITVNVKPTQKNTNPIRFLLASSKQLNRYSARKLSPDPFLILKTLGSYVLLHPQIVNKITLSYDQHLWVCYKDGKPSVTENLNKLYSFNSLSDNFNYRKLKTQLNGLMYTPLKSLDVNDDKTMYFLGGFMNK